MRAAALATLLLIAVAGVGAAGPLVVPPAPEQLVEGHTVYTVIQPERDLNETERYAAAVAVLVREYNQRFTHRRFPGVLWFNDQYLVEPSLSTGRSASFRYPCTGVVIAVNQGTAVPQDLNGTWTLTGATYNESYFITDPNDHSWVVDKWHLADGSPAWTAAILNNQAGAGVPDDGVCRGSTWSEFICTQPSERVRQSCLRGTTNTYPRVDPRRKSPGDNGMNYPCTGCSPITYNAVLYFRLEDLTVNGTAKNHTEGTGAAWVADASGCHPTLDNAWPCPGKDDDREGNSHPFNPEAPWPVRTYAGANNHGGSADCDGDGEGDQHCHATRQVDIYYGYQAAPFPRHYVVFDTTGSAAPYHCHPGTMCGPPDVGYP